MDKNPDQNMRKEKLKKQFQFHDKIKNQGKKKILSIFQQTQTYEQTNKQTNHKQTKSARQIVQHPKVNLIIFIASNLVQIKLY